MANISVEHKIQVYKVLKICNIIKFTIKQQTRFYFTSQKPNFRQQKQLYQMRLCCFEAKQNK